MKKQIVSALLSTSLLLGITAPTYAHPGRTDGNGGHTCRTNCENWGLNYGQYHNHNSGAPTTKPKQGTTVAPKKAEAQPTTVKVTYIRNGSAIRGYVNGKATTINLIGVKLSNNLSQNLAHDFLQRKILNQTVTLEFDKVKYDKQGNLWAYVHVGKNMINQTLVREGYARAVTNSANNKYATTLSKYEKEAATFKKGIWK
ncbi:thermonuclease family protein [Metabacillus iocasae]|uniref:Micrococcal nuclease n=1 Tax=Priestia iocasae TaxID=2291674 RepID=A0ABS2QXZ3_9BACI|nr:micrococcal nuclease [Metabacillus iocasae]